MNRPNTASAYACAAALDSGVGTVPLSWPADPDRRARHVARDAGGLEALGGREAQRAVEEAHAEVERLQHGLGLAGDQAQGRLVDAGEARRGGVVALEVRVGDEQRLVDAGPREVLDLAVGARRVRRIDRRVGRHGGVVIAAAGGDGDEDKGEGEGERAGGGASELGHGHAPFHSATEIVDQVSNTLPPPS